MKFTIILFFILISYLPCYAQVEIKLKGGKTITGFVTDANDNDIYLITNDKISVKISRKNTSSISKFNSMIITNSSETFTGYVYKTDNSIYYMNCENKAVSIPISSVKTIQIDKKNILYYEESKKEKIFNKENALFGFTLLYPGGLNLVFGYESQSIGLRGEFGYLPLDDRNTMSGYQINLIINLEKDLHTEHNISFGIGSTVKSTRIDYSGYDLNPEFTSESNYLGVFYDLNVYGFFFEMGLAMGSGSSSSQIFLAQFGYVFRFNN